MTQEELQKIEVTKNADSTVTFQGEIPFSYLEAERRHAVAHLSEGLSLPGFRKGNIPEKLIAERFGEMAILSEMAERALNKAYSEMLKEHAIDAIGYPNIEITKIAKGNPLGFKATVAVYPEVRLPDYKAIAAEKNKDRASDEVTDEDVDVQIKDILRQKAAYERLQKKAAEHTGETHMHADGTVHEGPAHDDDHTHEEEPIEDIKDLPIPELTDDVVKTLGQPGQFESVADFKAKIREHLEIQKKQDNFSKHRASITDAIVEKTEVKLPQVMIDAELNQMFAQMEEDLNRAQLKIDDYLSHMKKTREDLKQEWTPSAEKRAKLQLVLNEIAKEENLMPDEQKVEEEVSHLLSHYKDADKHRVEVYVRSVLTNEEVMKKLESLG